jgi:hypothetical protein
MAAIPVTIVGTITGKSTKEGDVSATEQCVIQGIASLTGLEVGGGPMPGGPPPQIWPSPGVPTHPIAPGGPPPTIWPDPGKPTHPIVLPPDLPPSLEDGRLLDWKAGWSPETGWVVVGVPEFKHPTPSK